MAIGRNEGERLRLCLESVVRDSRLVVYVDSGSTDGSVAIARAMGVSIVELDMRERFTAARARNDGFRRLHELATNLPYVQFVDGDCELIAGWLPKAAAFLEKHRDVAAVCGRLRERYPDRSVYNMLCDMEWDTVIGESRACGGIAMMRGDAFEGAGGFRADMIAGEEPELCVRLRASGWRIWRLDEEMAWHDAAISRFSQWWKRTLRAGYAFAQAASLHGAPPERSGVRESRSAWLWGLVLPAAVMALALAWKEWALILLLIYPGQVIRLAIRGNRSTGENWRRAFFLVLGKVPEMLGQLKFLVHRLRNTKAGIIEYK